MCTAIFVWDDHSGLIFSFKGYEFASRVTNCWNGASTYSTRDQDVWYWRSSEWGGRLQCQWSGLGPLHLFRWIFDDIFKCSFSIFSFIKLDINKIDVMHLNFRRTKAQKHRAGLSHWSGRWFCSENASQIIWDRHFVCSKHCVLNVQCRSTVMAGLVKSTFATLVKQTVKPAFIGNVRLTS